jgi:hypothetical protein
VVRVRKEGETVDRVKRMVERRRGFIVAFGGIGFLDCGSVGELGNCVA